MRRRSTSTHVRGINIDTHLVDQPSRTFVTTQLAQRRRRASVRRNPHALVLHAQAQTSVAALLKESESANTLRSYASALRYWAAWFPAALPAALALPVPVPVVLQFLVDHVLRTAPDGHLVCDLPAAIDSALVAGGFKVKRGAPALNTVMHRLAVLAKAHQVRDLANPERDPAVQEVVRWIRRGHATRGVRPAAKTALTRDPLTALLATCTDGLKGVRDRALLLFAWAAGAARRSPTP